MLTTLLSITLLLYGAEFTAPSASERGTPVLRPAPDSVKLLRVWTLRASRARNGLDEDDRAKVRALLTDLRGVRRAEPERGEEIDFALLDLAGLRYVSTGAKSEDGIEALGTLAQFADWEFDIRRRRDPEAFDAWLADSVLGVEGQSLERRIAAARLLRGQFRASTRVTLLRTARTAKGELRTEAIDALSGWPDPLVHQYFFDALEDDGHGIIELVDHLEAAREALDRPTLDRLRDIVGRLYLSEDWRDASRARSLVRMLDVHRAAPLLMEALAVWQRREETEDSSKRTVSEIVRELQRISGRSFRAAPERWSAWWQAVLDERVELPADVEEAGGYVSSTSFFGLNVLSDRVLFVIDRSGSMDGAFATDGRSRYEEAIHQFQRFLEKAGSELRFGVVLFSDKGDRWQGGLVPATNGNVDSAVRWLRGQQPRGGTQLFEGFRTALRLDRDGRLDPARQDADTVIVLCDGATAQGPDWVEPWIRSENPVAQLVFHAVQIGATGDGTLEALTERSGGDFVRVGR